MAVVFWSVTGLNGDAILVDGHTGTMVVDIRCVCDMGIFRRCEYCGPESGSHVITPWRQHGAARIIPSDRWPACGCQWIIRGHLVRQSFEAKTVLGNCGLGVESLPDIIFHLICGTTDGINLDLADSKTGVKSASFRMNLK